MSKIQSQAVAKSGKANYLVPCCMLSCSDFSAYITAATVVPSDSLSLPTWIHLWSGMEDSSLSRKLQELSTSKACRAQCTNPRMDECRRFVHSGIEWLPV